MSALALAPGLTIPADVAAVTKFGILAMSGAGKSNMAVVMAEEMHDAGIPWVAIDPKGDWWGIRSRGNGERKGLPIPVFGGLHGDVPLEPTAGKLLGNLIAERGLTCVLDVSEFDEREHQFRFLTDLAETLLRRNRDPLHLFLEEADDYLPQTARGGGNLAKCLGAWQRLVKRGRFRGMGVTLISQRSAALNKDVLYQADTLIAMRVLGKRDRDAIGGWVEQQPGLEKAIVDTLHELEDGEAWVWSPQRLKLTQRVRFRRRRTFDSGATPLIGTSRTPATLADVDLDAIKEQMADTIARAEADDPKRLRARIVELERALRRAQAAEPERVVERVEVPVYAVPKALADATRTLLDHARAGFEVANRIVELAADVPVAPVGQARRDDTQAREMHKPAPHARRDSSRAAGPSTARGAQPPAASAGEMRLGTAERKILTALAQDPDGLTRTQLTTLTGYTWSGGFRNYLSALRTAGYIIGSNQATMRITDAGLDALGPYEPLPTGPELLDYWLNHRQLGGGERVILAELVRCYPDAPAGPELAERCGYSWSGGFRNYLSKLRTLRLIDGTNMGGVRAHNDFMAAIQ